MKNAVSSRKRNLSLAVVSLVTLGLLFSGVSEAAWIDGTLKNMVDGQASMFADMTDAIIALAKLMAATGIAATGAFFIARKLGWK